MPPVPVEKALAQAHAALKMQTRPDGRLDAPTRHVAIGDPQAPLEKFLSILDHHGLLAEDGWLRRDVRLVSMGDHFDWGKPSERDQSASEGPQLLAWLAGHPPAQVVIIVGNHDLGRVGELASFDDASWRAAREAGRYRRRFRRHRNQEEEIFLDRYPMLPTAEICSRGLSPGRRRNSGHS